LKWNFVELSCLDSVYIVTILAAADVMLWRRRGICLGILVAGTTAWYLFERSGYTLLSLISTILLILVAILFIWANVASLLQRWVLFYHSYPFLYVHMPFFFFLDLFRIDIWKSAIFKSLFAYAGHYLLCLNWNYQKK